MFEKYVMSITEPRFRVHNIECLLNLIDLSYTIGKYTAHYYNYTSTVHSVGAPMSIKWFRMCSYLVARVGPGGGRHGDDGDREVGAHGERDCQQTKHQEPLEMATFES